MPDTVLDVVADLREMLQTTMEPPVYVSDRRLVKAIALMKVNSATALLHEPPPSLHRSLNPTPPPQAPKMPSLHVTRQSFRYGVLRLQPAV